MESIEIEGQGKASANFCRLAIDIGGCHLKVAYFGQGDGGKETIFMNIYLFDQLEELATFIKSKVDDDDVILLTGSHSVHCRQAKEALSRHLKSYKIKEIDEIGCVARGSKYISQLSKSRVYTYKNSDYEIIHNEDHLQYPYLVCTVGTGLSYVKVSSENDYSLVGGEPWNGDSFVGLGSLLLKTNNYDVLLEMASEGDYRNVHKTVGDMFGKGGYKDWNLKSDMLAGFFSKSNAAECTREDLAHGLLIQHARCIGKAAGVEGQLCGVKDILFVGGFSRPTPEFVWNLIIPIRFSTQEQIRPWFTRFDRYVTVIGALFSTTSDCDALPHEIDIGELHVSNTELLHGAIV